MHTVKNQWLIPLIIMAAIVILGAIFIRSFLSKEELPVAEVRSQLEEMYEGTVENIEIKNGVYTADVTRAGAHYVIDVDAINGSVLSMAQLSEMEIELPNDLAKNKIGEKEAEETGNDLLNKDADPPVHATETAKEKGAITVPKEETNGKVTSEKPKVSTNQNTLISKEQAIEIALGQLQGEVEEVKFEKNDEGGYYLIEIEQDNDDDDLEAVIQIHAITGKVMSVLWDD